MFYPHSSRLQMKWMCVYKIQSYTCHVHGDMETWGHEWAVTLSTLYLLLQCPDGLHSTGVPFHLWTITFALCGSDCTFVHGQPFTNDRDLRSKVKWQISSKVFSGTCSTSHDVKQSDWSIQTTSHDVKQSDWSIQTCLSSMLVTTDIQRQQVSHNTSYMIYRNFRNFCQLIFGCGVSFEIYISEINCI